MEQGVTLSLWNVPARMIFNGVEPALGLTWGKHGLRQSLVLFLGLDSCNHAYIRLEMLWPALLKMSLLISLRLTPPHFPFGKCCVPKRSMRLFFYITYRHLPSPFLCPKRRYTCFCFWWNTIISQGARSTLRRCEENSRDSLTWIYWMAALTSCKSVP